MSGDVGSSCGTAYISKKASKLVGFPYSFPSFYLSLPLFLLSLILFNFSSPIDGGLLRLRTGASGSGSDVGIASESPFFIHLL
jgi:hypothetical protein